MFSCIFAFASLTFAVWHADMPDIMNCLTYYFQNVYITLPASRDLKYYSMFL